ncbi:hypothetical protein BP5796_08969 [Coleophoma crateriformis]|uniref:Uncharacterized protein n=1 Tax=Coleophoma crateriformis TaxID=565419 RepID=A0A3D8R2M8_9HELO|nr:hypothetical protein BP5796_08969 [Coleophoma crateriformis]
MRPTHLPMPFGSNTICFQTATRKRVRSISTSTNTSTHPSRSPIKKLRSSKSSSSIQPHLDENRSRTSHGTCSHYQRKINQVLSTIQSEEEDVDHVDAASEMDICDGFESLSLDDASTLRNQAEQDSSGVLRLEAVDEWDRWSKVPFTGSEAQPVAFLQGGDGGGMVDPSASGLSTPPPYENGHVSCSSPSVRLAEQSVLSKDLVWTFGAAASAAAVAPEKDYVDWESSLGCAAGDFPGNSRSPSPRKGRAKPLKVSPGFNMAPPYAEASTCIPSEFNSGNKAYDAAPASEMPGRGIGVPFFG